MEQARPIKLFTMRLQLNIEMSNAFNRSNDPAQQRAADMLTHVRASFDRGNR